jgi:hypothetical protein
MSLFHLQVLSLGFLEIQQLLVEIKGIAPLQLPATASETPLLRVGGSRGYPEHLNLSHNIYVVFDERILTQLYFDDFANALNVVEPFILIRRRLHGRCSDKVMVL